MANPVKEEHTLAEVLVLSSSEDEIQSSGTEGESDVEDVNVNVDVDNEKTRRGGDPNQRKRGGELTRRSPSPSSSERSAGFRKGATVVAVLAIVLWFVLSTYQTTTRKPQVTYATRYSKEHRFRPAASPIITETLKDGRIRIRGAEPTTTSSPKATPATAKRKRKARSKPRRKVNKKRA